MRKSIIPSGSIAGVPEPQEKRIVLYANFPAKKNKLRTPSGRAAGHNLVYRKGVAAMTQNLVLQARAAWGPRPYLESPDIEVFYFTVSAAKDRDGIWTTLLDVLKQARILFDDSIRWSNGTETHHPATLVANPREERVEILLRWGAKRVSCRPEFSAIVAGWSLTISLADITEKIEAAVAWAEANGPLNAAEEVTILLMVEFQLACAEEEGWVGCSTEDESAT
jgi:hypothetical protein